MTSSSTDSTRQGPACSVPAMHKRLLYLVPQQYEQVYFGQQLRALDLSYAITTPLFMTAYLQLFPFELVSAVYYIVLLLKGFHLALLLVPQARHASAHMQYRYRLILADRVLRQWVAAVLITWKPRPTEYLQWISDSYSGLPGVQRTLLVVSGLLWICLNTFLLPLDFRSQLVLNSGWFVICFRHAVTQVAYAVAVLIKAWPQLVWAQWWLEVACRASPGYATAAAQVAGLVLGSSSGSNGSPLTTEALEPQLQPAAAGSDTCSAQPLPLLSLAAQAVAVPARPAPDLTSTAGRLTLALSTSYMLLVVWFLPLFLAWQLERHLKSKFMVVSAPAAVQQQQQGPDEGSLSQGSSYGNSPSSHTDSAGARHGACQQLNRFHTAPVVLPLFLSCRQLCKVLALSCTACLVAGELFVLLCVLSPAVAGMLRPQIYL